MPCHYFFIFYFLLNVIQCLHVFQFYSFIKHTIHVWGNVLLLLQIISKFVSLFQPVDTGPHTVKVLIQAFRWSLPNRRVSLWTRHARDPLLMGWCGQRSGRGGDRVGTLQTSRGCGWGSSSSSGSGGSDVTITSENPFLHGRQSK
jgi:hypothetical protein